MEHNQLAPGTGEEAGEAAASFSELLAETGLGTLEDWLAVHLSEKYSP